jgi:hypothetical protein
LEDLAWRWTEVLGLEVEDGEGRVRWNRVSPYITPLLGRSVHTSESEWDLVESDCPDSPRCSGMIPVEFRNQPWSVNVVLICPRVFLVAVSFPCYEILELSPVDPAVENCFQLVFRFSIYDLRVWRCWGLSAFYWILRSG